jgi:ATP-dependent DNA ligase
VSRDEAEIELQSKSGRVLTRYFPELVEAVRAVRAKRFMLDAETMVPHGAAFSFDALQRIHPAPSRVRRLAQETPAQLIVFDLLAGVDGAAHVELPLKGTAQEAGGILRAPSRQPVYSELSPATIRLGDAKGWFARVGTTLDGIIAKRRDFDYRSEDAEDQELPQRGLRGGGFRYNEGSRVVGSLLLGLYDGCCITSASPPQSPRMRRKRSPPGWRS